MLRHLVLCLLFCPDKVFIQSLPIRSTLPSQSTVEMRRAVRTARRRYATRYHAMVLQMEQEISLQYGMLAGSFAWLLLVGFLLSPATYTSARYVETLEKAALATKFSIATARNIPVIGLACAACVIATVGLGWLWWKWRHNYVWINRHLVT